jgi:hypothetical protein
MKTLSKYLILVMLLSPIAQLPLKAETPVTTAVHSENLDRNAAEKATMARLKAIQQLTKTKLSKAEKKALREELKAMKSKQGPVIFISTGALILIIILLIILL